MATTYTSLTLAYLEENLYEIIGKYSNNMKIEFIRSWEIYLDDCFIWKYSWGIINDLHNLLQNLHPKIKFAIDHSFKEQPFFVIFIKNQNCLVITDIYYKPTDT